jgi:hypothetical protein
MPPESPTTARPLDFDDDAQDQGAHSNLLGEESATSKPSTTADVPPAKPPRPLSPREQAENTLKEAFPSIDAAVVRAVLTASGGSVEPAFNALLGMSDPDSQNDAEPPAKPPRPAAGPTSTAQSQLEADELYARQLHEHYSGASRPLQSQPQSREQSRLGGTRSEGSQRLGQPQQERSFIDGWSDNPVNRAIVDALPLDDLPVIRDNIRQGFLETQSTVNKWISGLRKKLDGDDENDFTNQPPKPAQGYPSGGQSFGRQSGEMARQSADRDRYDADPELIGDDFSRLELRDNDTPPKQPPRSTRPLANPDLFKPTPAPSSNTRKVSFQEGPPEEIRDMYSASPVNKENLSLPGKSSKWQPLSTVDPSPVADNDPFSLGDSDEEKDAKAKDSKTEESERLQKDLAEATEEEIGSPKEDGKTLGAT